MGQLWWSQAHRVGHLSRARLVRGLGGLPGHSGSRERRVTGEAPTPWVAAGRHRTHARRLLRGGPGHAGCPGDFAGQMAARASTGGGQGVPGVFPRAWRRTRQARPVDPAAHSGARGSRPRQRRARSGEYFGEVWDDRSSGEDAPLAHTQCMFATTDAGGRGVDDADTVLGPHPSAGAFVIGDGVSSIHGPATHVDEMAQTCPMSAPGCRVSVSPGLH